VSRLKNAWCARCGGQITTVGDRRFDGEPFGHGANPFAVPLGGRAVHAKCLKRS